MRKAFLPLRQLPEASLSASPDEESRPSKTQRKQGMHDLQELGERLARLPASHLKAIALPESLYTAIRDYQRFTKHEALRRQMQYIGKLMRGVDSAPIVSALNALQGESAAAIARMHQLEDLRRRFLDDQSVVDEILAQWPHADRTRLCQLRRQALKEQAQASPPRSFRLLFKALKSLEDTPHAAEAHEATEDFT